MALKGWAHCKYLLRGENKEAVIGYQLAELSQVCCPTAPKAGLLRYGRSL